VFELQAPAVPHASLVDASRLVGSDTGSFRALERFMTHFQEALRRWVLRLALVRPPGISGAMVAGVFEVVPRPYPVRVFDGVEGAVQWLDAEGRLGAAPADVVESVAALHGEAERSTPLVVRLRSFLESRLSGIDGARREQPVDLAEAARALGTSDRSLQRRLREADTSFSAELAPRASASRSACCFRPTRPSLGSRSRSDAPRCSISGCCSGRSPARHPAPGGIASGRAAALRSGLGRRAGQRASKYIMPTRL
jgi:hypothetical protein